MLKAMAITLYLFWGLQIPIQPTAPEAWVKFVADAETWEDVQVLSLVLVPPHHILPSNLVLQQVQSNGAPTAALSFLASYLAMRHPSCRDLGRLEKTLPRQDDADLHTITPNRQLRRGLNVCPLTIEQAIWC